MFHGISIAFHTTARFIILCSLAFSIFYLLIIQNRRELDSKFRISPPSPIPEGYFGAL
jgi:hypothetical protein